VVIRKFVAEVNAGMLRPEGASKFISHISKSGLCKFWNDYKARGISGLVPRYKYKGNSSTQKPTFRFVAKPFEMKFAGRPRRNGKKEFQARIRRRWKWPPSENPIRLAIYYSMPIPKGIKMPMRKKMIRQKMFHINKPNIDALNGFVVDCFSGIVLKDHSQIVHFHSEKKFETWPQVRILIQELKA
jgi:Holliday junction resolvase RusA-like endonuclease